MSLKSNEKGRAGKFLITFKPIQNRSKEHNQRWVHNTKSKQTSDWIPFTNFLNNGEQSFSLKISMSPIIRGVKRLRWAKASLRIRLKIFARSNLGMLTDNYGQVLASTRHLTDALFGSARPRAHDEC